MKETFAKRLYSARKMLGISMDELVKRINGAVSKNAISKYEKGLMMPNSTVLIALCNALNVKPDYLFRTFNLELSEFDFRKKSKLTKGKLESIKEIVKDKIERYIELENILGIDAEFKNVLSNIVIESNKDVDKAIAEIRNYWGIGVNSIHNVIQLLEDKEVKVIEIDAPMEFDGLCAWANDKYPIIVLNKNFPPERKRFTALHELAHLLLNIEKSTDDKVREKLCNYFSSSLLIDNEVVTRLFSLKRKNISFNELKYVQQNYGVSIPALMYRLQEMKIVSESQYKSFYFKQNNSDYKAMINESRYSSVEKSNRFKRLIYFALSKELISVSKAVALSGKELNELLDLQRVA